MMIAVLLSVAAGAPSLRLVKDDFDRWSQVAVAGEKPLSLRFLQEGCPQLETAPDATLLFKDLEGDGVADVALWSPSTHECFAWWKNWSAGHGVKPLSIALECSALQSTEVCWGFSSQTLTVIRDHRLEQVFTSWEGAPSGEPFQLVDLTFDGVEDLVVSIGGADNAWFAVLPFDTRRKRFVRSKSMANLSSPEVVDAKRHLIDSTTSLGQAGAVYESQLLEVHDTEARVVASAKQDDAWAGSITKQLTVNSGGAVTCVAIVEPGDPPVPPRVTAGHCNEWPLFLPEPMRH